MTRVRIRPNENGSVDGFLGAVRVVTISDGQIQAPLGIGFGTIGQAESLLKCYGKAIEVYKKRSSELAS